MEDLAASFAAPSFASRQTAICEFSLAGLIPL
jgi:hypothetical protein